MRKAVRLVFKPGSHEEIDGQLFAAMVRKAKGPEPPDDELLLNRPSNAKQYISSAYSRLEALGGEDGDEWLQDPSHRAHVAKGLLE